MNRLNALGASLRLHTTRRYMDGTAGPPFRKILDNLVHKGKTIHVGVGSCTMRASSTERLSAGVDCIDCFRGIENQSAIFVV